MYGENMKKKESLPKAAGVLALSAACAMGFAAGQVDTAYADEASATDGSFSVGLRAYDGARTISNEGEHFSATGDGTTGGGAASLGLRVYDSSKGLADTGESFNAAEDGTTGGGTVGLGINVYDSSSTLGKGDDFNATEDGTTGGGSFNVGLKVYDGMADFDTPEDETLLSENGKVGTREAVLGLRVVDYGNADEAPADAQVTWSSGASDAVWGDGSSADKQSTVTHNIIIKAPEPPTRPGYAFAGWSDGTHTYSPESLPAADAASYAFTAQWRANTNTPYKVEHYQQNIDDDGYTLVETEDLTGTTGTKVTVNTKTYEGFDKGMVSGASTIAGAGDSVAVVKYDRKTYEVTATGDENTDITSGGGTYRHGASVNLSWSPKDGYEIASVTLDGADITDSLEGANYYAFESVAGDHTIEVTTKVRDASKPMVTFDHNHSGDTTHTSTAYADDDGKVAEPSEPVQEGYVFEGWYTGTRGEDGSVALDADAFDFDTTVTEDMTLYAKWTEIGYTVEFYRYSGDAAPFKTLNGDDAKAMAAVSVLSSSDEDVAENGVQGHKLSRWYAFLNNAAPTLTDGRIDLAESAYNSYADGDEALKDLTWLDLAKAVGAQTGNEETENGATIKLYATWTPVYSMTLPVGDAQLRSVTLKNGVDTAVAGSAITMTSETPRSVDLFATSELNEDEDSNVSEVLGLVTTDSLTDDTNFTFAASAETSSDGTVTETKLDPDAESIALSGSNIAYVGTAEPSSPITGKLVFHMGREVTVTLEMRDDWGRLTTIKWLANIDSSGTGADTGSWLYANAGASSFSDKGSTHTPPSIN